MTAAIALPRAQLSSLAIELIARPEFAVLSTRNEDGSTHQCVMWIDEGKDGDLLLASRIGRRQVHNLERDPRASVLLHDRRDPIRYVHIKGLVVISPDHDNAVIDRLSHRYVGRPHTSSDRIVPGDRLVLRLTPLGVVDHPRPR